MIAISAALQAKLASGATTLAWCWKLTRLDGVVFGFTDHDMPLSFGGVVYAPESGLSPGHLRTETGLAPARGAAFGVLTSDVITPADLDNGLWDGARVEIYRVDWSDPSQRWQAMTGVLGAISRTEYGFEVELEGLTARLNQTIGRVFSRQCDATLGDSRCGLALDDPAYRAEAAVLEVLPGGALRVEGLSGYASGWFAEGQAIWLDGANAGARHAICSHAVAGDSVTLVPRESLALAVAVGDRMQVTAGCDKRPESCREKFNNFLRFRGHPHMPGNDVLLRHAGS